MSGRPEATTDFIVVLPGIMGSTLRRRGELVWAPSAGAVIRAIGTFGRSVRELTLPEDIGDEHPGDGVEPDGIMPDLHVLPGLWSAHIGYGVLLDWLRSATDAADPDPGLGRVPRFLAVPYDWRLSNRYNGRRLKGIVEPALERWRSRGGLFAHARLIFVCHSMGGLVARWYIEKEGGRALTRKLITFGTPFRGALTALEQLVNGVRKGPWPFTLNLTAFARSLPSLHQLMPEYACLESPRGLLKTTERCLPELDTAMVADAMRFHDELDGAAASRFGDAYDVHPIVGIRQPTRTTARIVGGALEPIESIDGVDEAGDASVPRLSAVPRGTRSDSPAIRWTAEQHGSLPGNQGVLEELEGILTARPVIHRAVPMIQLGVRTDPLVLTGEAIVVEGSVADGSRVTLQATVVDEVGMKASAAVLAPSGPVQRAELSPLPAGGYRVIVGGVGSTAARVATVTANVLVWDGGAS